MLEEINRKLTECRQLASVTQKQWIPCEEGSPVGNSVNSLGLFFGPPATEAEVLAFESKFNITLPEDYRAFLLEIGNGKRPENSISSAPWYRFYSLQQIQSNPTDFFGGIPSLSFPHTQYYDNSFLDPCFDGRDPQMDGTMRISEHGCVTYAFLVLTGEERGHMWKEDLGNYICPFVFNNGHARFIYSKYYPSHEIAAGLPRVTFTQWYEDWLDYVIEALQTPNEYIPSVAI